MRCGLLADYKYFFLINQYDKPKEFYWPLLSLWWSFHGGLWIDQILIPLAGIVALTSAALFCLQVSRKRGDSELARLLLLPEFGASVLAVAGIVFFMTIQNHIQPRYFAVPAFFCFLIVALGIAALYREGGLWSRRIASAMIAVVLLAVSFNALETLNFVLHPEYTYVDAARHLTQYIDAHPNGNRLLVSVSGDQITLLTHLPTLCDDFGSETLEKKMARYQPGWYASWNDLDPAVLEEIHTRYWLEQVASFPALDDPDRNLLVLFKLHPLPNGQVRNQSDQNLQILLPDDKVEIEVE